jgi:hypothetical protein
MKLPSIKGLFQKVIRTIQRFPLSIIDAFLGTLLSLIIVGNTLIKDEVLIKTLMTLGLGLPLFISLELMAERRQWPRVKALTIGFIALAVYFFTLNDISEFSSAIRFTNLIFFLTILITIAPLSRKSSTNTSWEYNRALLQAFSTALTVAIILFAGIAVAFVGIDYLLDIQVPPIFYLRLLITIFGFICILIFLAGIPENLRESTNTIIYPKQLEVFTKYIFIPLVIFYLFILYAYIGKIIATASWPKGGVSGFILGFSGVGIISMLLIYPIKNTIENRIISLYIKWFYAATIPLSAVMFLAVWRRISEYGITESRYFGIVTAIWLAFISSYFLVSKSKNIKIIPVSLCIVALLSSFGPWGSLSVSERSQIRRLKTFLVKNNMLINEKIQKTNNPILPEEATEISKIVKYLSDVHNLKGIQRWFSVNLQNITARERPKFAVEQLGIIYQPYSTIDQKYFFLRSAASPIKISGYDYYINFDSFIYTGKHDSSELIIDDKKYEISLDTKGNMLLIKKEAQIVSQIDLAIFITPLLQDNKINKLPTIDIPKEKMALDEKIENIEMKIYFAEIDGYRDENTMNTNHIRADILLKIQ